MDGPHDLGGKDGFGPIDVDAPPFRNDWEQRQWALSKNVPLEGGTIDWWRHGIENMDAGTYLTIPYFEKWCLNELAHRVDQGMFTLDEATSGRADTPGAPAAPRSLDDARDRLRANNTNFKRNATAPAAFAPGDSVTTTPFPIAGHSRLPAYARGKTGTIHTLRGAYPDPTEGAKGNDVPTHLYTVEFASTELWGPDQNPSDTVLVDVFEGDLVSA